MTSANQKGNSMGPFVRWKMCGGMGGCCPGKIQRSWAVINSRAEEDTREGTAKVRDFVSASKGVR